MFKIIFKIIWTVFMFIVFVLFNMIKVIFVADKYDFEADATLVINQFFSFWDLELKVISIKKDIK